jgi:hypothetical protein
LTGDLVQVVVALWVLLTLDGAFAGFRDAAGRSPRLDKRTMVVRGVLRGAGLAQVVSLLVLGPLVWMVLHASATDPLPHHVVQTGAVLTTVFGTYAALVLSALAVYAVPHPDVSSLATVLVLGPFTLGRPLVVAVGGALGMVQGDGRTAFATAVGCAMVLGLGPLLQRRWEGVHPTDAHRR